MRTTYSTRDEAIQREIVDPIEAGGVVADAWAEYDIEAIADLVIATDIPKVSIGATEGYGNPRYFSMAGSEEFWVYVRNNELAGAE